MEESSDLRTQTTSPNTSEPREPVSPSGDSQDTEDYQSATRFQGHFGSHFIKDGIFLSSAQPAALRRIKEAKHPKGVSEVRNFQDTCMKSKMWPGLSYKDQCNLKKDLAELQTRYSAEVQENRKLKEQLSRSASGSRLPCANCVIERGKRMATQVALTEAMDLSNVLLKEVKRLDSELALARQSPKRIF